MTKKRKGLSVVDGPRNEFGCLPGVHCSDTNTAWQNGCRHPGAVEVHRKWVAEKRLQRNIARSAPAEGGCQAATHGTRYAAEVNGCWCPKAIEAKKRHDERQHLATSYRDYATNYALEADAAKRRTGGRLNRDPRRPWRGGNMAVSGITLALMLEGVLPSDGATARERLVADIKLDSRMVWDRGELWTKEVARWRKLTDTERANIMNCTVTAIKHARNKLRPRLRAERTLRRLADSRWRIAVAEEAAGRKERERERHAKAHRERGLREERRRHDRTLRKMARARELVLRAA